MNRFSTLSLLVLITLVSACAKPLVHYSDDHAIFLEKAKAGWRWQ